jgi:hypothetical protein
MENQWTVPFLIAVTILVNLDTHTGENTQTACTLWLQTYPTIQLCKASAKLSVLHTLTTFLCLSELTVHDHKSDHAYSPSLLYSSTLPLPHRTPCGPRTHHTRKDDLMCTWEGYADYSMYSTFLTASPGSVLFSRSNLLKSKDLCFSCLRLGLIRHRRSLRSSHLASQVCHDSHRVTLEKLIFGKGFGKGVSCWYSHHS